MAYAFISGTSAGSSSGTEVTTGSIDTTGADVLVVVCSDYEALSLSTITDSKFNTWLPRTEYKHAASGARITVLYAQGSITVGSGHTFTATGFYPSIAVLAFSGAHATPYANENGANSSAVTSLAAGSITPPENDCLIISGVSYSDTTTLSVDAGMTISNQTPYGVNVHFGVGAAYKIQTSAAAINPTWSWTNSSGAAVTVASFKAVAGAAIAPPGRRALQAVQRASNW